MERLRAEMEKERDAQDDVIDLDAGEDDEVWDD